MYNKGIIVYQIENGDVSLSTCAGFLAVDAYCSVTIEVAEVSVAGFCLVVDSLPYDLIIGNDIMRESPFRKDLQDFCLEGKQE